ncbi:MAG TPA: 50S ribosomal protein L25 [Candidatus Saccharimonadales bacterium]|nr:50S ribosomal protein L25 [Candidatus Saccharimonadales bacterium]
MELKLTAQKRAKNEKLDKDSLAAVLYGNGIETQSLKLKAAEFVKIFAVAGESNLIKLDTETGMVNVLVKSLQKHPLKNFINHVDFYQVNMKEKVNAEIPLHFIGESKVVREMGGMLNKEIHEIAVECLPSDLVDHIDVDVSVLDSFDDVIKISDLNIPQGLELSADSETIVAMVMKPKVEEEEPEAVAAETVPAEISAESEEKDEKK